jgi:rhodanese-related sulfurtransferase
MLIWPLLRKGAGGPWVTSAEATQMINRQDAVLLDVREPGEYAAGHIIGARNVPLAKLEEGAAELKKLKSKPVIAYCGDGNRASKALGALRRQGFENVANLTGGYAAWQQAGLPVER